MSWDSSSIKRASDWHTVMEGIEMAKSYPKPTKADRPKKRKVSKPRRKILEAQLEDICRQLVFWRDGSQCIERDIDGVRCGGGIQWGHYIPRQQSKWLKYDLGNTFCQCRNHNNLHDKGAQTMAAWFGLKFGAGVQLKMEQVRDWHRGAKDRTIQELEEMLAEYDELLQNRYHVDLTHDALMAAGYYGKVHR